MRTTLASMVVLAALSTPSFADPVQLQTSVPNDATTVTNWYKQSVYDPNSNKIGEVTDVLTTKEGTNKTLIVGVGGFLGVGEKDVAVPFNAVTPTKKEGKWYLTMDTTKDALKSAPGFKYDKATATWAPDNK